MARDKEKQRNNKRRFYEKQRAQGLCLECNKRAVEGKVRCKAHILRRQEPRQQKKDVAHKSFLCAECFREARLKNNRLCETCYYKSISRKHFDTSLCWKELQEKFKSQAGRCALSGLPLALGVNAELDHIIPKARQGCKDAANTQWVLRAVNRMKNNMLERDFYTLIEALYKHRRTR